MDATVDVSSSAFFASGNLDGPSGGFDAGVRDVLLAVGVVVGEVSEGDDDFGAGLSASLAVGDCVFGRGAFPGLSPDCGDFGDDGGSLVSVSAIVVTSRTALGGVLGAASGCCRTCFSATVAELVVSLGF